MGGREGEVRGGREVVWDQRANDSERAHGLWRRGSRLRTVMDMNAAPLQISNDGANYKRKNMAGF